MKSSNALKQAAFDVLPLPLFICSVQTTAAFAQTASIVTLRMQWWTVAMMSERFHTSTLICVAIPGQCLNLLAMLLWCDSTNHPTVHNYRHSV